MRRRDIIRTVMVMALAGGLPAVAGADELVQRPVKISLITVDSDAALPAWLTTVSLGFAGAISPPAAFNPPQPIQDVATNDGWAAAITRLEDAAHDRRLTTGSIGKAGLDGRVQIAATGPRPTGNGHSMTGVASYYWQGQMTATGERFNKRDLTAAHKTLPFGTRVRVTCVDTGRSVVVRINDRGPFKPGRVIDLSERAAEDIGMTGRGLTKVRLEVIAR